MRRIRFLLNILLALCLLLSFLPAAAAEEAEDERFADKTWDEVVDEFLQSWGTERNRITLGYYNTVTGEEHYLNPDQYMVSGSMYKVPLNMVYTARIADGEMDWDTVVGSYKYEVLLEGSIVHSDNDFSKTLWMKLGNGNYRNYRRIIAPLMGEDPDTVGAKFYENNFFTARQMIFCLRELYENQDHYPRVIESMQRAEPTEYFKRRERRFDIAHKYGFLQTDYHLYLNDCGIAFTDDPILMVMFTDNVVKAYEVMTEYCTLMCDYAQYHTAKRHAEEEAEAQRKKEEAERAAEEARLEAERLEQEAERLRQEAAEASPESSPDALLPSATPESTETPGVLPLMRRVEQDGLSATALIAGAAALLSGITVMIWLAVLGKKYRVRSRWAVLTALLLCLATLGRIVWPAFRNFRDRPQGDPQKTVEDFLTALEQQDYAKAYACMDGVESLGLEKEPEQENARRICQMVREQFSGETYGSCSTDGNRAYQLIECRYIDVEALQRDARSEAMTYISRYASTHSVSELYDENNNYRPELMREAWSQALDTLLEQPEKYLSAGGAQVELRWRDGAWRIVPGEKLLEMLCGGLKLTGEEQGT